MEIMRQPRYVSIAVDMQNDFITGSLPVPGAEDIIQPLNEVHEAVYSTLGDNVETGDCHPEDTPHFITHGGRWPEHCIEGTEGAQFHPNLIVRPHDIIIRKGMGQTDGYSAWNDEDTPGDGLTLKEIITPWQPDDQVRVALGGVATEHCVVATALPIANHFKNDPRVKLYLLTDAIRGIAPEETERAICDMETAGWELTTSAKVVAEIGRVARCGC